VPASFPYSRRERPADAPDCLPVSWGQTISKFDFMKRHFALFVGLASALVVCHTHAADAKGLPHGGTPVIVGSHGYHLELVRDAEKGRLQAYVLDGHAEKYVDVPEKSFDMVATVGGKEQRLTFNRVAAPGKTLAADSNVFEGTAAWVKSATNFNAVIPTITLKGKTFKDVKVTFPKGSIHSGH
jgi:hypothetical protein